MADHLTSEITRLQGELDMVNSVRGGRRRTRAKVSNSHSNGSNLRPGTLRRDDLFKFVAEQHRPISPAEMREILVGKGYDIATAAVRTGMSRLVRDERLVRVAEGLYAVGSDSNGTELESESPAPPGTFALD